MERFGLLTVCHANLCRSPMAERLFRQAIDERLAAAAAEFDVFSAGTHAWHNEPMHPLAAEVMREHGADEAGFQSRRLSEGLVNRADLVLTATRKQRAACVAYDPAAVRRTFTIAQFGRYAAAVQPTSLAPAWEPHKRLRALIDEVAVVRAQLPVAAAEADDMPDPVNSPIEVFRRCAGEIRAVVDVMMRLIAPM